MFKKLTQQLSVAGQISPEDVAAARAQGFATIINNRPDGEAPDQPPGAAIATAAEQAGLRYAAIPVGQAGVGPAEVDAMAAAIAQSPGPVLAFCRSGNRSTQLWALAAARNGRDPDEIIATAAAAGYDVARLRPLLTELAASGTAG